MCDEDPFGPCRIDGGKEFIPIRMIGENESVRKTATLSHSGNETPSGDEGDIGRSELSRPCRPVRIRGSDQDGFTPTEGWDCETGGCRTRELDAGKSIFEGQLFDIRVEIDRSQARIESGVNSLGFAEGVGIQNRNAARFLVRSPPIVDLIEDLLLIGPDEGWFAESRFGDERMAADRFESRTGLVGSDLVISGDDPDFTLIFDANLSRPQNVSGGMERNANTLEIEFLAVVERFYRRAGPQPSRENSPPRRSSEVSTRSLPGVIRVRVRDNRPVNRLMGINKEFSRRTEESGGRELEEGCTHGKSVRWGDTIGSLRN